MEGLQMLMRVSESKDNWKTPTFRAFMTTRIEKMIQPPAIVSNRAYGSMIESRAFRQAKTMEEYFEHIIKIIFHIRKIIEDKRAAKSCKTQPSEKKKKELRPMSAQYVDLILGRLNGPNPAATFAELNVKNLHKLYVFEWLTSGFKVRLDRANWKTTNEFRFQFSKKFLRLAFMEDAIILMNIENKAVRAIPYYDVKFDIGNQQQPQHSIACSDDTYIKFEELNSDLSFFFYDDIMLPLRMGTNPVNATRSRHQRRS